MKIISSILLIIIMIFNQSNQSAARVRQFKVETVKEFTHDDCSYTQGLFFKDGVLYESSGMYGESAFKSVNLNTGKPLRKLTFNDKYFIEGSTILGDELFILTWENRVAFIYDSKTLKYKKTVPYLREGWGLTTDGKYLIASDGSSKIFFMDKNYKTLKTINVHLNGRSLPNLNELEYINGKIWANVYLTDMIVIINPDTGEIESTIDCTGLLPDKLRSSKTDVLNGIAYNPLNKKIYLTGKYWKRLYEIRLIDKNN